MKPVWLVSACLLGERCRYDGKDAYDPAVEALKEKADVVAVCPETLGGLCVPRTPCEIVGGTGADVWKGTAKVLDREGFDRTQAFLAGAEKAVAICERLGAENALVKSYSPACGCGTIYDGSFTSGKREGNGVFTQRLLDKGVRVVCNGDGGVRI